MPPVLPVTRYFSTTLNVDTIHYYFPLVSGSRFWGIDIPYEVSKHTLPFLFRYFAIYVNILF